MQFYLKKEVEIKTPPPLSCLLQSLCLCLQGWVVSVFSQNTLYSSCGPVCVAMYSLCFRQYHLTWPASLCVVSFIFPQKPDTHAAKTSPTHTQQYGDGQWMQSVGGPQASAPTWSRSRVTAHWAEKWKEGRWRWWLGFGMFHKQGSRTLTSSTGGCFSPNRLSVSDNKQTKAENYIQINK